MDASVLAAPVAAVLCVLLLGRTLNGVSDTIEYLVPDVTWVRVLVDWCVVLGLLLLLTLVWFAWLRHVPFHALLHAPPGAVRKPPGTKGRVHWPVSASSPPPPPNPRF